jgi:hypothetical protein
MSLKIYETIKKKDHLPFAFAFAFAKCECEYRTISTARVHKISRGAKTLEAKARPVPVGLRLLSALQQCAVRFLHIK